GGDDRVPVVDRLLEAFLRGDAFADLGPLILDAVRDDGPAVVLARLGAIELVATARAVLDRPQPAARVEGGCLDIAVAVRPDLRLCIGTPDEGIVFRHTAVRIQAHDLAEVCAQILRLLARFGHGALAES